MDTKRSAMTTCDNQGDKRDQRSPLVARVDSTAQRCTLSETNRSSLGLVRDLHKKPCQGIRGSTGTSLVPPR